MTAVLAASMPVAGALQAPRASERRISIRRPRQYSPIPGGMPAPGTERVVVLVPAHNEAGSIAETVRCALDQERVPDAVVVIANNCSDDTAAIAARFPAPVIVLDVTVPKSHGKSRALNLGWRLHCQDADVVVCLDADTSLPRNAIADWVQEFQDDDTLAGSSSKFTMRGSDLLTRMQRAEFARWTDRSLRLGWTPVLGGTGCALRQDALMAIAALDDREGPWSYSSQVEDFELTYQLRLRNWLCRVSPTVRAYTDSMKTVCALWGQRMKWQVGTIEDLMRFGINRLTWREWHAQLVGVVSMLFRTTWVGLLVLSLSLHVFVFQPQWLLVTLLVVANDVRQSLLIPHRDRVDVLLAATLLPKELMTWLWTGWFVAAWREALVGRITHRSRDRWALQYRAEGA